jgi:gluconate 2-dehydrogenase gamma chain
MNELSRRELLRAASIYGGALWTTIHLPRPAAAKAAATSETFASLSAAESKILAAIAARILPSDESPGAQEAGCIHFIDKALAHEDAAALPLVQFGCAGIEAVAQTRFAAAWTALSAEQQDTVLVALETGTARGWPEGPIPSPLFFETLRVLTLIGFLADPKHGGNRDFAGWKLVGYPGPRHAGGGYTPDQMLGKAPIPAVWGGVLGGES